MPDPASIIQAASAAGSDPALARYMPRIVSLESGGNPSARTGSYTGLLQMGPDERARYGGDDLSSGMAMYRDRANAFAKQYGRSPTATEFYLANQQGPAGLDAHLANPEAPAWQNMASTGEGRQKGAGWAKQAIWGNVPSDVRANYPGGVDSLTSGQFMDIWRNKLERGQGAPQGLADASSGTGAPISPPHAAAPSVSPPGGMAALPGAAPDGASPGVGMLSGADLSSGGQQGPDVGMLAQRALALTQMNQAPQAPPLQPMQMPMPPGLLRARLAAAALGRGV
jgi:hypothetical protein